MPYVRATPGMDILTNSPNVPIYQGDQTFMGRTGQLFPGDQNMQPQTGMQALRSPLLPSTSAPIQQPPLATPVNNPITQSQQAVPEDQKLTLGQRFANRVRGWFGGGYGKPRTGAGEFWLGKEEEKGLQDILTPEQIEMVKLIGPEGVKMLLERIDNSPIQDTLSQVTQSNINRNQPFDFTPFKEQALQRFNEETLPGIFNRFTSLGKGAQSTGAFRGMLARGGADLNRGLAALEQEYGLKNRELEGREGLRQQELLQNLLGQQQTYDVANRRLGLDTVKTGLTQTASPYYKGATPGALPEVAGSAAKAAAQAALLTMFL